MNKSEKKEGIIIDRVLAFFLLSQQNIRTLSLKSRIKLSICPYVQPWGSLISLSVGVLLLQLPIKTTIVLCLRSNLVMPFQCQNKELYLKSAVEWSSHTHVGWYKLQLWCLKGILGITFVVTNLYNIIPSVEQKRRKFEECLWHWFPYNSSKKIQISSSDDKHTPDNFFFKFTFIT